MTKYLIIALLAALAYIGFQQNRISKVKEDRDRHEHNYNELNNSTKKQIQQLKLTKKEFEQQYKDSIKHLTDSLKIKQKRVIKYITNTIVDYDTMYVEVPVIKLSDSTYQFNDNSGCFDITGNVTGRFIGGPQVSIIEKSYINKTEYLVHQENKYKFFLKNWLKKDSKINKLEVIPECGKVFYKEVEIVK